MPDLTTELIVFCILSCLSAKDVATCKSVCKQWHALLSTPEFEMAHCSRSSLPDNQRTLLARDSDCAIYIMDFETAEYALQTIIPYPFEHGVTNVAMLGHLDGLLCVCLRDTKELVLWNPTTAAYKCLANTDGQGLYEDITDAVGFYSVPSNDYKVLHLKRQFGVLSAHIYSRHSGSWRNLHFQCDNEYAKCDYYWSPGTVCGNNLYFTVCECWVVGRNVVIGFDTITEQVIEIPFPSVPPSGIFQAILSTVHNSLHMLLATGMQDMTLQLWSLEGEHWVQKISCPPIPPIPLSVWVNITHYMTTGRWFVMSGARKLYEFPDDINPLTRFYPVSWFRGHMGAVFVHTIISPAI
ncbi:putative F-box protein At3g16210 [Bidens hawaiensis]|uniref:putative F-box protein At3g16210 n=1 Tax=Bidens hawaiensis TaxID=980011 RepID=UPI004049001F